MQLCVTDHSLAIGLNEANCKHEIARLSAIIHRLYPRFCEGDETVEHELDAAIGGRQQCERRLAWLADYTRVSTTVRH
jgi:hypothetical protein